MTNCSFRFNICGDCDFSFYEFEELTNIFQNKININKNEINKKLRNSINTMNIQIDNIEFNNDLMIIDVNVNPI